MTDIRPAQSLGATSFNGADTLHHFCFGRYQAANRLRWGRLRMLNRIRLAPRGARAPNFLGGVDVVLIVLSGEITARCGETKCKITAGGAALLAMKAGGDFGIANAGAKPAELLEIWLTSEGTQGLPQSFRGRLTGGNTIVASNDAENRPTLLLSTPATIELVCGSADEAHGLTVSDGSQTYICVLEGRIEVEGSILQQDDSIAIEGEHRLITHILEPARYLIIRG